VVHLPGTRDRDLPPASANRLPTAKECSTRSFGGTNSIAAEGRKCEHAARSSRPARTVGATVEEPVEDLRRTGATVERIDGAFEDWETPHDALEVLLQDRYGGMYDNFVRDYDIDLLERREDVTEEVVSRVEKALELDALDVRRAERVRTEACDAMRGVLSEYDLLVTPTMGLLPFETETKPSEIDGVPVDPLHGWALTWPFNLTGNPVAAVPAGIAEGLPVGLQIVGRRLDDETVVSAAAAYERIRPWNGSYPAV